VFVTFFSHPLQVKLEQKNSIDSLFLIQIESRGLSEVGLYRVPGSEREVKDLKEKFLKGKGSPILSKVSNLG
jgi:hypothetical protein